MTERMIENRIRRLQEIEAQQKDLEAQAEAIRTEIKDDMESRGVDELKTKDFIVRWKEIISSRLDSKKLKAALPDVYSQYLKQSNEFTERRTKHTWTQTTQKSPWKCRRKQRPH